MLRAPGPVLSDMPYFGILSVNKPANCTSRRALDRVERLVRPAKAGHAGTLDPLATGVLVICVGQATRLISYVQQMPKTYRATFLLGHRSETDDTEGEVTELDDAPKPTRQSVNDALSQFLGDIEQVPPAHSAVKVGGRRAYKLARAGRPVELSARTVTIHRLAVRRYEYPELELDIECGSGTYVRALGRDMGAALGTRAVMSALERTAIGVFQVAGALALNDISASALSRNLQPALAAVATLPRIELDEKQIVEIRHGRPIAVPTNVPRLITESPLIGGAKSSQQLAAIDRAGKLVAILIEKVAGQLWPTCNFQ